MKHRDHRVAHSSVDGWLLEVTDRPLLRWWLAQAVGHAVERRGHPARRASDRRRIPGLDRAAFFAYDWSLHTQETAGERVATIPISEETAYAIDPGARVLV